jgi:uncharacterized protein (DUF362 family)
MSRVSISTAPSVRYPADFEPGNAVYELVRRALHGYGCDAAAYGTDAWNPLGQWIKPGQRVFVLPNFVMHRRAGETVQDFEGKCTHASVLRAVLDYAMIAAGDPGLVAFGNAPIQGCDYAKVAAETGADRLAAHYRRRGHDVGPIDLRVVVSRITRFGAILDVKTRDPSSIVDVDIGAASMLEPLYRSSSTPEVRVADYPPSATMRFHGPGRHVYQLHKKVLEADVIISVPKLKVHQKVGITCALKGTVGAIASKECLAHHRRGGPAHGGDEFPTDSMIREAVSRLVDAGAAAGTDLRSNALRVAGKVLARALRFGKAGIWGGAWFGNDTAWRMALDIARIVRCADVDGKMLPEPRRQHLVVVDGVVGGEGEGPLRPTGRAMGTILFSPDAAAADWACACVMGYRPQSIPLVAEAMRHRTVAQETPMELILDGAPIDETTLAARFDRPFAAPKGWRDKMTQASRRDHPGRFAMEDAVK